MLDGQLEVVLSSTSPLRELVSCMKYWKASRCSDSSIASVRAAAAASFDSASAPAAAVPPDVFRAPGVFLAPLVLGAPDAPEPLIAARPGCAPACRRAPR